MLVTRFVQIHELMWNVLVQRHQMWINDGTWRRSWVCALGASKENIKLNGVHCKGVRNVFRRRLGATTPPITSRSHRAIAVRHFDPPPPPPKTLQETRQQMGKANRTICGVPEEAASVPRNPEKVALQMVPVILEGENGIKIKTSAFLGSSGSSYFKEYIFDYWAWTLSVDHSVLMFWKRGRLWRIEKLLLWAYKVCMEALRSTCFYG